MNVNSIFSETKEEENRKIVKIKRQIEKEEIQEIVQTPVLRKSRSMTKLNNEVKMGEIKDSNLSTKETKTLTRSQTQQNK